MMAQVVEFLSSKWKTWIESLAHSDGGYKPDLTISDIWGSEPMNWTSSVVFCQLVCVCAPWINFLKLENLKIR